MRGFGAGNGSIISATFFDFDVSLDPLDFGLDLAEVLREELPPTFQPILIDGPDMISYSCLCYLLASRLEYGESQCVRSVAVREGARCCRNILQEVVA